MDQKVLEEFNKKKYTRFGVLKKDIYITRLSKASGVSRENVRKVINAMPEVVLNSLGQCEKISPFQGIVLEGVKKDPNKRTYFDTKTNTYKQSTTLVLPRCIWGWVFRDKVDEVYKEKKMEKEDSIK